MLKEELAQLVRLSIFSDICVKDVERLNEGSVKRCPERAPFLFHSVVQLDIENSVIAISEVNRVSKQSQIGAAQFVSNSVSNNSVCVELVEYNRMNDMSMVVRFVCHSPFSPRVLRKHECR